LRTLTEPTYVIGFAEVGWGAVLIAMTLTIHACGVLAALRTTRAVRERIDRLESVVLNVGVLVLGSWILILVHLLEVGVWAAFLDWRNAVDTPNANISVAYYFSLMEYTTLGSNYNLTFDWRLLEGMNGIAGLLTFAWTTSVLLALAQDFQTWRLAVLQRQREKATGPRESAAGPSQ